MNPLSSARTFRPWAALARDARRSVKPGLAAARAPALTAALTPALAAALVAALLLTLAPAGPAHAQDRADIDRTQILGNRELPKVLTIVPWRKPLPGDLGGRPGGSLLDEALAPVDREVFRRQIGYDAQLQARRAPAPAAPAGGSNAAAPAPSVFPSAGLAPAPSTAAPSPGPR